jgi:hypothetical protein
VCIVCCRVEVSATSWSLVQRSPTECGAPLCVIKKLREWEGHTPRWAAEPEKIINIWPWRSDVSFRWDFWIILSRIADPSSLPFRKKIKLSLCMNEGMRAVKVQLHSFVIPALGGIYWSVSWSSRFNSGKKTLFNTPNEMPVGSYT